MISNCGLVRAGLAFIADCLAVSTPGPAPADFGSWMQSLFYLGGCFAFLFFIWNQGKAAIGRKPPIEDDYRSQQRIISELKEKVAGLAPREAVNEVVKSLGGFATAQSVRDIELILPEFIKRQEFEEQFKLFEVHIEDGWRQLRKELSDDRAEAERRREGVHNRMNLIAEAVAEIRGWIRALRKETSV